RARTENTIAQCCQSGLLGPAGRVLSPHCRSGPMNTVTYAPTAYRPDRIPAQLPSSERSWLKKMGRVRLPWGNTQELAPARFFYKDSPERLRIREQVEREDAEKKVHRAFPGKAALIFRKK